MSDVMNLSKQQVLKIGGLRTYVQYFTNRIS